MYMENQKWNEVSKEIKRKKKKKKDSSIKKSLYFTKRQILPKKLYPLKQTQPWPTYLQAFSSTSMVFSSHLTD